MVLRGADQVKRGEHRLAFHLRPCSRAQALLISIGGIPLAAIFCMGGAQALAQSLSSPDNGGEIRGVVIDSVSRQPISRALVYSPDNRFATLTNSEGRFEFVLPKADEGDDTGSASGAPVRGPSQFGGSNRPYSLMARKPSYLSDPNNPAPDLPAEELQNGALQDLTLTLLPESLIVGTVTLPTSEAPDNISLQIFRRQVQDGRTHWVAAGGTQSTSDGQFRFADLQAGTYKLLTQELLDRDPLNVDPLAVDPATFDSRGSLFGYPPVYYQNAPDFGSAGIIHLSAGQTQTANLTLVKKPYYRVKIPVIFPGNEATKNGVGVEVYANGHKGPGFRLGYNNQQRTIEGMLPNGTYTVAAKSYGQNAMTGLQTITIKGGSIDGPPIVLAPGGSIPVNVKEEFTSQNYNNTSSWSNGSFTVQFKGPRRYLSVTLEPVEDFGMKQSVMLRNPTAPGDEALVLAGAAAGSYWVKVNSQRGYPAAIRSGNLDLERQPLVVGVGGGANPIEITMRDDTAEISGTVEGITSPARRGGPASFAASFPVAFPRAGAYVFCIPLPDSGGQFREVPVNTDGSFDAQGLPPGAYRLLAFEHPQFELEYRNPEAMQAYDSKGPTVRVVSGQKERVTLQLISTGDSASEQ